MSGKSVLLALSLLWASPSLAYDTARAAQCNQQAGPVQPSEWLSCCLAKCGDVAECATQCNSGYQKLVEVRQGEATRDQKLRINLPKLSEGQ